MIKPEDTGKVKGGTRVRAVFAEERVGAMEDIKYFEVGGLRKGPAMSEEEESLFQ